MSAPHPRLAWRRAGAELALLLLAGLFLGFLSPFGSAAVPAVRRYLYWTLCIVGGGAIGIAVDAAVGRRTAALWPRLVATSVAMTPPVAAYVMAVEFALLNEPPNLRGLLVRFCQVFAISAAVMSFRALLWRRPAAAIEIRTVVQPPSPEAEAAFRRRLSAKRRLARLIAVEAHDHYLRVHTDAGAELVTLRFTDALEELSGVHGHRIHRSWWVAADAIEAVRWRRGAGEAKLAGEVVAPVSRTYAPALKAAGWF